MSNYAFKPIAEQALRSNQPVVPQRLNAALDLVMKLIVTFQNIDHDIATIEEFGVALDRFDAELEFELWVRSGNGPSICMLRNRTDAWLMYLRHSEDDGFTSEGVSRCGTVNYRLGNGQVDQYPATWCVPVETCYKALAFFYVNDGQRPDFLKWLPNQTSF